MVETARPLRADDIDALGQAFKEEYTLPVLLAKCEKWTLPSGAFGKEGCGSDFGGKVCRIGENEMARSPIEMMVDQACGVGTKNPMQDVKQGAMKDDTSIAKALERLADAAVVWHAARAENRMTKSISKKLDDAAAKLVASGW